jgi:plasmid stabilization system protein ParE
VPAERYRIRITRRAAEGLVKICAFIERDSPENAAKVAQELLDAIDALTLFPHRYRVHEHCKDPSKTVHAMPVPPLMVYYRIVGEEFVEVIRVLHGRRRQPRRFR